MGDIKGSKDSWRLGVLHVEYEKLRKYRRNSNSNDRENKLAERIIGKWKI